MPPVPPPVSLCLACSASLPPRKAGSDVFYTQCCSRPICPNCISSNQRLARYNPCLRCLAGVEAVNGSGAGISSNRRETLPRVNVDGSVRDEDVFVVDGDSEDSDASEDLCTDEDEESVQRN